MIDSANRAILAAFTRARRRRAATERYPALIQAIDELLFELEELNLHGIQHVPTRLRERSARVLDLVPTEDPEQIRIRYRVIAMMDTLFRAQELVFRAKDPSRPAYEGEEDLTA